MSPIIMLMSQISVTINSKTIHGFAYTKFTHFAFPFFHFPDLPCDLQAPFHHHNLISICKSQIQYSPAEHLTDLTNCISIYPVIID